MPGAGFCASELGPLRFLAIISPVIMLATKLLNISENGSVNS